MQPNVKEQAQGNLLIRKVALLVDSPIFFNTVIGLILFNAVIVGLETYPAVYQPYQHLFYLAERLLIWAFTLEIALRIIATRPWYLFFKNGWNLFDFIIVASSLLFAGTYFISLLRILRVLRVLRTISVIPSLQRLVVALFRTVPAIGNILLLMSLLFYIFAVIGTILFKYAAPEYFGSLHLTLLTLFQVVTLESWASGVMRPLMLEISWSWLYFVLFILAGTFVIFNLFVGVIVNNVQQGDFAGEDKVASPAFEENSQAVTRELAQLRKEITELKEYLVNQQRNG
jgi:voltage-gated sodium channel